MYIRSASMDLIPLLVGSLSHQRFCGFGRIVSDLKQVPGKRASRSNSRYHQLRWFLVSKARSRGARQPRLYGPESLTQVKSRGALNALQSHAGADKSRRWLQQAILAGVGILAAAIHRQAASGRCPRLRVTLTRLTTAGPRSSDRYRRRGSGRELSL